MGNFSNYWDLHTLFTKIKNKIKSVSDSIPTKLSQLTNDSNYLTKGNLTDGTINSGVLVKGRVYGTGDDEGIVINKANNGYATLTLGSHNGERTLITLMPDGTAKWRRVTSSGSSGDIIHPGKSGTIALTSDIPDQLSDLTDDATHRLVTDTEKSTWNNKSDFSGNYNDLTNKPTIPAAANNGTLTIQKNGTTVKTFSANQSTNDTANITVPTALSDLTDDATHRLVTDTEKSTWDGKAGFSAAGDLEVPNELHARYLQGILKGFDTRSVDSPPSFYITSYATSSIKSEFKQRSTIGAPGSGTYGQLVTFSPWQDHSGGYPTQVFFDGNSNAIAYRKATSTAAWGNWATLGGTKLYMHYITVELHNRNNYVANGGQWAASNGYYIGYKRRLDTGACSRLTINDLHAGLNASDYNESGIADHRFVVITPSSTVANTLSKLSDICDNAVRKESLNDGTSNMLTGEILAVSPYAIVVRTYEMLNNHLNNFYSNYEYLYRLTDSMIASISDTVTAL